MSSPINNQTTSIKLYSTDSTDSPEKETTDCSRMLVFNSTPTNVDDVAQKTLEPLPFLPNTYDSPINKSIGRRLFFGSPKGNSTQTSYKKHVDDSLPLIEDLSPICAKKNRFSESSVPSSFFMENLFPEESKTEDSENYTLSFKINRSKREPAPKEMGIYEKAINMITSNLRKGATRNITLNGQEIHLTYLEKGDYKKAFSFIDPSSQEMRVFKTYLRTDEIDKNKGLPESKQRKFREQTCADQTQYAMKQYHKLKNAGKNVATIYNDPEKEGYFITEFIPENLLTSISNAQNPRSLLDQVADFCIWAIQTHTDLDLNVGNLRVKDNIVYLIDFREDTEINFFGDEQNNQNDSFVAIRQSLKSWKTNLSEENYQYLKDKIKADPTTKDYYIFLNSFASFSKK